MFSFKVTCGVASLAGGGLPRAACGGGLLQDNTSLFFFWTVRKFMPAGRNIEADEWLRRSGISRKAAATENFPFMENIKWELKNLICFVVWNARSNASYVFSWCTDSRLFILQHDECSSMNYNNHRVYRPNKTGYFAAIVLVGKSCAFRMIVRRLNDGGALPGSLVEVKASRLTAYTRAQCYAERLYMLVCENNLLSSVHLHQVWVDNKGHLVALSWIIGIFRLWEFVGNTM